MRTNTIPLEAETRVLIDHSLESLGWKLKGKGKNVYFEQPKTEVERKKLDGKRPDYVLYSGEKPLIVIEAKKKGARIDAALEQGIDYARAIDAPLVFATDGVFCKTYHTVANRPPLLNGEEIDELIREALALRFLTSFEVNTISPKVQYDRKELIRIFDEANNMLRGDGLRAGIERFGEFANILFLKLVSENEQFKKESGIKSAFDISSCSWDSIKNIAASARIEYINNTVYPRLNKLYQTEIFTPLTIRDDTILKEIMDKLDPLTLTDVDSDVKGDAFEYFLKASTATKNDLGEYFTPRHIVKTMVRLVNPKIGEKIYDPFCGTGGFLIEAFRHIERNMGTGNPELRRILREETIFGNEITNTARITKMNMILAGDGHSNIHMVDSLANPTYIDKIKYNEKGEIVRDKEGNIEYSSEYTGIYDVVITNMPYSQKTKHGNLYDLPSTNGDSICVQHCMKAISSTADNGRMALVVPEGFLFRKDLARTREYLLNHCQLQSVISLPQGVFLPYTGVKTDIIYATKVNQKIKRSDQNKNFWYFEVKSDGLTLDNHRRKDSQIPNDLAKFEEYRKLDVDQAEDMLKVGFEIIPFDRVRESAYVLVGSRYRKAERANRRSEFDYKPLKEVCEIVAGQSPKGENYNKDGIGLPFYQGNVNFGDVYIKAPSLWTSEITKEAYKGDVLLSVRAPVGAVNICDKHICIGRGLACLRPTREIDYKFLYYLLKYYGKDLLKQLSMGSTFEAITRKDIEDFVVPVPSIEVQQQIISELDRYQDIIAGARKILEGYIPRIICEEGKEKSLEEIATFKPSKDEVKNFATDMPVSFVPMSSINTFDASFRVTEERKLGEVLTGFTYFKNNDILLAKITPCFENGKAGIARNLKNGIGFGSTEYIVIRANLEVVYPEWIFYHINTKKFISEGKAFMTGTAGQQRVDVDFVKHYRIPVPSLNEQRKILDQISYEQSLVDPSKKLIDVFTEKIEKRIKEIWGE